MRLEIIEWDAIVEALLFAAGDEGLSIDQIASVLEVTPDETKDIISGLQAYYDGETRGIQLVEIAGAYQLTTKKIHAPYLQKLVEMPSAQSLSQAALETLAIIAYKQPITRMEIEAIRGVRLDGPLQKLLARVLVREVGRTETVGKAILYGTTDEFLDYFGLKSLAELPELPANGETTDDDENDLFSLKFQEKVERPNENFEV